MLQPEQTSIHTRTVGTLSHQPPEMLITNRLSREVDVYAFGIISGWRASGGWECGCQCAGRERKEGAKQQDGECSKEQKEPDLSTCHGCSRSSGKIIPGA